MRTASFYTSLAIATVCGAVVAITDFLYGEPDPFFGVGFVLFVGISALVDPMSTPDASLGE